MILSSYAFKKRLEMITPLLKKTDKIDGKWEMVK